MLSPALLNHALPEIHSVLDISTVQTIPSSLSFRQFEMGTDVCSSTKHSVNTSFGRCEDTESV